MKLLSISPRLLLPLMILMGLLVLGMRVDDLWTAAEEGHLFSRDAQAQSDAKPADAKPADTASATATAPATPAADPNVPAPAKPAEAPPPEPSLTSDAPQDSDMSPGEMEVLKQLSARRAELDHRSKDLDTRESLMKVAEQRVDAKIKEMEMLRRQLQGMVNQVDEKQAAQLDNLVKIYETMKPEEAAHIFETLDEKTLLAVVQRMKPKSTGPIMAKMAPDKAKDLTMALTKQDQLPQIK